jgi:hypothetical protein
MTTSNPWLIPRRTSPNAEKLVDGGVQRMSVLPDRSELHLKMNTEKVGFYNSDELTERASRFAYVRQACPYDDNSYHRRIVRINLSQVPHTQNHP